MMLSGTAGTRPGWEDNAAGFFPQSRYLFGPRNVRIVQGCKNWFDARAGTMDQYVADLENRVQILENRNAFLQDRVRTLEDQLTALPSRKRQRLKTTQFLIVDPVTQKADKRATCEESVSFWKHVPKTEGEWLARREKTMTATLEDRTWTFCTLTRLRSSSSSRLLTTDCDQPGVQNIAVADVLHGYQALVRQLECDAVRATQTWNYSMFVLVGTTMVLKRMPLLMIQ